MLLWTDEEYKALQAAHDQHVAVLNEQLQRVCTLAATHVPVKFWGRSEAAVWGCILTKQNMGYCDECPVTLECPYPYKEWSK